MLYNKSGRVKPPILGESYATDATIADPNTYQSEQSASLLKCRPPFLALQPKRYGVRPTAHRADK